MAIELFHVMAHILTATGIRTPTRQYIVSHLAYFYIDALSVLMAYLYTRKMLQVCAAHIVLHIYFIVTWDKSEFCKDVISRYAVNFSYHKTNSLSSSCWDVKFKGVTLHFIMYVLGTSFDVMTHVGNVYFISNIISRQKLFVAVVLSIGMTIFGTWKDDTWKNRYDVDQKLKKNL